ncbi:MAG TPA: RNA polymerase sigma factor [Acidimicrobiales bacterium]|jgi:RNA polymerase sigma-70 factor (ECF subfamily)|nr:RNA polymerase sigma factor [Acidimicrobiales bacterium]
MTADLAFRLGEDLEAAFPDVVAGYGQAVFTTALRMAGRAEDAADLAAETFLRAYVALRSYPPARRAELQLRPWLLTIVLNLVRNEARAASRRPAQVAFDAWTCPNGRDGAPETPEDSAQRHDGQARLGALLTRLPDGQRTAVVLRHVVGLPYAEVATVMGCPEGTAKSHVARGLQRLRASIPEEAP